MKYVTIILLLGLSLSNTTNAQFTVVKNPVDKQLYLKSLKSIYNFEFKEADSLISVLENIHPRHPSIHMLRALNYYWQMVFVSKDHPKFKAYRQELEQVVIEAEKISKNKTQQPEAYFFLIGAHTSLSLVYSKQKEYAKALGEARMSYKYMKEGFSLIQNNPDFHFSTGLYNFYVVQYPETHPIMKPFMWFFSSGDMAYGLKQLQLGSEQGIFTRVESIYFLSHIYLKYKNQPELALPNAKMLATEFPKNIFFKVRFIETLIALKKYDEALEILPELDAAKNGYFTMVKYYFTGLIKEGIGKYQDAKVHYLKGLEISINSKISTSDYVGMMNWRMAKILYREQKYKEAHEWYKKADETVEYQHAQQDVKEYFKNN